MGRNQRKKNLILPGLQLKITLVFLTMSMAMAVLMGYLMVVTVGDQTAGEFEILPVILPSILKSFVITLVVMIPTTIAVGVLSTFMVAGPLYRFEMFLNSVIKGENPPDCRLREGDELKDFCKLLNRATAPLRLAQDQPLNDEAEAA